MHQFGCVTKLRFVDLTQQLCMNHRESCILKMEQRFSKSTTTKGSKHHHRQCTIMGRSLTCLLHIPLPQLLSIHHQETRRAGRLQHCSPASATSAWEKLKLSSHLACLKDKGGSSMCQGKVGNWDCGGPSVHSVQLLVVNSQRAELYSSSSGGFNRKRRTEDTTALWWWQFIIAHLRSGGDSECNSLIAAAHGRFCYAASMCSPIRCSTSWSCREAQRT